MIDTGARIYDPHYSTQILSIDGRRPPWRESDESVVRPHGWPEAAAAPCIRRWSIIFSNGTKHGLIPTTNFPRTTSTMNPSHQRSKSKRPSSLKFPTRRFSIIYCLEGLDLAHSIMPRKSVEIWWFFCHDLQSHSLCFPITQLARVVSHRYIQIILYISNTTLFRVYVLTTNSWDCTRWLPIVLPYGPREKYARWMRIWSRMAITTKQRRPLWHNKQQHEKLQSIWRDSYWIADLSRKSQSGDEQ